ncbi:MAG: hypothetical protein IKR85_09885 [Clostridia bacterium]|nr:hypothetical protein [Clostridia bacterium]
MKYKYTSSQAAKVLRGLNQKRTDLLALEAKSSRFVAALEEDMESIRPPYDFAAVQAEIGALEKKIRALKHAISVFNLTTEVPGTGMTIDEVLVYLPQLAQRCEKLRGMQACLPKERSDASSYNQSNFIEYKIANYDIDAARAAYAAASNELSRVQLALDKANMTNTFEVELED